MKHTRGKVLNWLSKKLPNELIYYVLINSWAYVTTGKYSNVEVTQVKMSDAISTFSEDKGL